LFPYTTLFRSPFGNSSADSVRFNPSGVSSNAHAITRAMGKPIAISIITSRIAPVRNLKKREDLRRDLHQQPRDDCVSDCDLVNVTPLQFAEEGLRIHLSILCHTATTPSSRSASAERDYICLQRQATTEQLATMPRELEQLNSKIDRAVADGQVMESAAKNIRTLLEGGRSDLYLRAVDELVNAGEWSELNDRFYQPLAFGTGGLRGRTIGKIVTPAERGNAREDERPEFPCVGTNTMNYYNISRATQGLVAYVSEWNARPRDIGLQPIDRQDADATI